jgi:hypothetical protein
MILGFVQFVANSFYLYVVTEKKKVGTVNGASVYAIVDTELLPITKLVTVRKRASRHVSEEAKLRSLFLQVDLTDEFYFSYYYDITNPVEANMSKGGGVLSRQREHEAAAERVPLSGAVSPPPRSSRRNSTRSNYWESEAVRMNEYFVWTLHLLEPLICALEHQASPWIAPLIHGFFRQRRLRTETGRTIAMTLVARRSRHFAGTRYLRRGANIQGNVANEVETEQILCEEDAGGSPPGGLITSMVQVRGSIPLHWCHENLSMPKPDFLLWKQDKEFQAANLHFDNLITRYTEPVVVLNLIKQEETGRPKETLLFDEFTDAIRHLNMSLASNNIDRHIAARDVQGAGVADMGAPPPMPTKRTMPLIYITFDFLKCARSTREPNVLDAISEITSTIYSTTGFFRTLPPSQGPSTGTLAAVLQEGIMRTNCIDCLDRTNVAQFCLGRECLQQQLEHLGVDASADPRVWKELMKMYADHGNKMGNQYGGSGAMHSLALAKPANGNPGSPARSSRGSGSTPRKGTDARRMESPERVLYDDTMFVEDEESNGEIKLTGGAKNAFVAVTRYLSNNFSDSDKQRSLDLFLGVYNSNNGFSGQRKDVERAASIGGSLFEVGFRCCSEEGAGGRLHLKDADASEITSFDDELNLSFQCVVVDELLETAADGLHGRVAGRQRTAARRHDAPTKNASHNAFSADSWLMTSSQTLDDIVIKSLDGAGVSAAEAMETARSAQREVEQDAEIAYRVYARKEEKANRWVNSIFTAQHLS